MQKWKDNPFIKKTIVGYGDKKIPKKQDAILEILLGKKNINKTYTRPILVVDSRGKGSISARGELVENVHGWEEIFFDQCDSVIEIEILATTCPLSCFDYVINSVTKFYYVSALL